jgi:hypothetical protein
MIRKNKRAGYWAFFLFFAFSFCRAFGQTPVITVGILAANLNEIAEPQQKSEWCWAASIQLALSCYKIHVSQADIVARTYGTGWDDDPVNHPGSDDAITKNLSGWGIDSAGHHYAVGCFAGEGPPNAAGLIAVLKKKYPVLLAIDNGGGGGHAIVCTAVSYVDTPAGPVIQNLIVRDPYPYLTWQATHGRYVMPWGIAVKIIRGFWIVVASTSDDADDHAKTMGDQLNSNGDNTDGYAADQDATSDIDLDSEDDNYDSDSHVLTFKLDYKNTGDKPIHVSVTVKAMHGSSDTDQTNQTPLRSKTYKFDLAPDKVHEISGSWTLHPPSDEGDPELHYGGSVDDDDKGLLTATYISDKNDDSDSSNQN